MDRLQAKDILFLVGSGISCGRPSSLPLGSPLTEFVLRKTCGDYRAEKILEMWKAASRQIEDYDPALSFPFPRLETVCGCIHGIDRAMKRGYFLNGFASYAGIPYNYNHYLLSRFLGGGATVLTTNFDLGIEKAYSAEGSRADLGYAAVAGISCFETEQGGNVYHLHGHAEEDALRLGVTVANVKKGFGGPAKEHLAGIINAAELVCVLGYGVTDSFDITPLMESGRIAGKEIVYIAHMQKGEREEQYPSSLTGFMKNFRDKRCIGHDTTDYLEELAGRCSVAFDGKKRHELEEAASYDWEKEFCAHVDGYSDDDRLLNYLGIRYQLGFNPCIAEGQGADIAGEIRGLKGRIYGTDKRIDDYLDTALEDFDRPIRECVPRMPDEPEQAQREELKEKSHLLALRDECDYYLYKYRDCNADIEDKDRERIGFLFSLLCGYSEYGYDRVRFISYINSCLKYRALFSARFMGECPVPSSRRELELSLEISYFEGVVNALLHSMESIMIYNRINGNGQSSQLEKIKHAILSISSIIKRNYYKAVVERIEGRY